MSSKKMIDVEEIKRKIISYLKEEGPSIPVRISKKVELSPVFSSAILSELLEERKIKTSNLRFGSSPLYLIPGDEKKLENFTDNLNGIEKTAYLKLKNSIVLEDEKQEPSIRVALRSIKDFAKPIKFQEKFFWMYAFSTNKEVERILSDEKKIIEKPQREMTFTMTKTQEEKEKPLLEIKQIKRKEKKIPEEFLNKVKEHLIKKDIELLETIEIKKKEFKGKIRINSDLGKMIFLIIAKEKRRPSLSDLNNAMKEAIHEKMPCYFLAEGEPASTTKEFIKVNENILKLDFFKN